MTDPQWDQLKGIVADALEKEPGQRAAFLDSACGGNDKLRHQAEALLEIQDEADAYFEVATQPGAPDPELQEARKTIGRYTTRRVIATGGMGTVYEAEQDHPRRQVALKVLRHGAASSTALRRFRHEAEILGRLRHPNIAQIHDAGTIDASDPEDRQNQAGHAARRAAGVQPYFAMELVKGRPLIEYCASAGLGTRERLRLFTKVCHAVQYAHQQGVIHRDLKPDNILVDDFGEPKILDFGVARATDSDMQLTTVQTDIGQLIGTVPYMSPEQVTGDPADVDTRSDVYSLGVVLYELLCGQLPHDLRGKSIPDAVRVIQESDHRPLSSISRVYRGDVETIVAKALEKEKQRRYQTAAELAADIGHYLADEPIVARPASTFYQLRKFARRNRALVGGVVAVMLVLVAGTVVALGLAVRARSEATKATRISDYMMEMFADLSHGDELHGLGVPDPRGAVADLEELADRAGLALTYYGLQRTSGRQEHITAQQEHFQRAYELRARSLGDNHPDTLLAFLWVADNVLQNDGPAAAEPEFREAVDRLQEHCGERDRRTLVARNRYAQVLARLGKLAVAVSFQRETLDLIRQELGEEHRLYLQARAGFAGLILTPSGKYEEAQDLLREGLAASRRVLSPDDAGVAMYAGRLIGSLVAQGKSGEADAEWQAFREHPHTSLQNQRTALRMERGVAEFLMYPGVGKYDEAEQVLRDALDRQRASVGDTDPTTLMTMEQLGSLLQQRRQFAEAAEFFLEAAAGWRERFGPDDPNTLRAEKLHEEASSSQPGASAPAPPP
ncbi:MAG: serine/threonine protein kinase [Planctomycetota bacterium]|jgi:tetratricopeptide (TPR) repeat protein